MLIIVLIYGMIFLKYYCLKRVHLFPPPFGRGETKKNNIICVYNIPGRAAMRRAREGE